MRGQFDIPDPAGDLARHPAPLPGNQQLLGAQAGRVAYLPVAPLRQPGQHPGRDGARDIEISAERPGHDDLVERVGLDARRREQQLDASPDGGLGQLDLADVGARQHDVAAMRGQRGRDENAGRLAGGPDDERVCPAEAAALADDPGRERRHDRVEDARAADPGRRAVADGVYLEAAVQVAHALDRPGRRAHAVTDVRPLERRPGRARAGP